MKENEKEFLKLMFAIFFFTIAALSGAAQGVAPEKRVVVSRDTILDIENVKVFEKENKKGVIEWKSTWHGTSIYVSQKDAELIADQGALSFVVINHYSTGEVIRSKVITKPNN